MENLEDKVKNIVEKKRKNPEIRWIMPLIKEKYPFIKKEESKKIFNLSSQCLGIINYLSMYFPEGKIYKNFIMKNLGYENNNIAFLIAFDILSKERENSKVISFFRKPSNADVPGFYIDISHKLRNKD